MTTKSVEPSVDERVLDADINSYISSLVGDSHQEIYFRGWVTMAVKSKALKKRILVLTNFRFIAIKINILGRSVRQNISMLHIARLSSQSETKLVVEFTDHPPAYIEHARVTEIAQHILFANQSLTYGRPPSLQVRVDLPAHFLEGFLPPEPDQQDGLLACYLAECDALGVPQAVQVLDFLMGCFQLDDNTLDLGEAFAWLDKDAIGYITALANSLRWSPWFNEIVCQDYGLKDAGVTALSPVFQHKTVITRLALVNIKAGRAGFSSLAKALSEGKHGLNYLNISKNNLTDGGIQSIAEGLEIGRRVLHTLCLRACGFSSKAFKPLTTTLGTAAWLQGLKVLDVSDNRAGKSGTQALADWLSSPNIQLEELFLVRCELDLDVLLQAILSNPHLYQKALRTLNLSGNKLTKKSIPLLSSLVTASITLNQLYLANTALTKTPLQGILDGCFMNKNNVKFALDFSENELGVKGAKDIAQILSDWRQKDVRKVTTSGCVHSLILNDNGFGVEGVITLVKALQGSSIHTLAIDMNLKVGMFSSGKEAGEALAQFMQSTPSLRELSIVGDDNKFYFKTSLYPVLEAIAVNATLTHLDVSGNKLGDAGITLFAQSLVANTSLTSFNIENNRVGLQGLKELHKACSQNKFAIDWTIPLEDITKVFKTIASDATRVKELRNMIHEFEMFMERNDELASKMGRGRDLNTNGHHRMETAAGMTSGKHKKTASRMFDNMFLRVNSGMDNDDSSEVINEDEDEEDIKQSPNASPQQHTSSIQQSSYTQQSYSPPQHAQSPVAMAGGPPQHAFQLQSQSPPSQPQQQQPVIPQTSPVVRPIIPASVPAIKQFPPPATNPIIQQQVVTPTSTSPTIAATPSTPGKGGPPPVPVGYASLPKPVIPGAVPILPTAGAMKPAYSTSSLPSPIATPTKQYLDPSTNSFPFEQLRTGASLPQGVDPAARELYLSDEEFVQVFSKTKAEFAALAKWKQMELKRGAKIA